MGEGYTRSGMEVPPVTFLSIIRARFIVIVSLGVIGALTAILLEYLRPEKDNMAMVGVIVGLLTALLAYLKSEQVHVMVNDRMTQWMKAADEASEAVGHRRAVSEMEVARSGQIELTAAAIKSVAEDAQRTAEALVQVATVKEEKRKDETLEQTAIIQAAIQDAIDKITKSISPIKSSLPVSKKNSTKQNVNK